MSKSLEPTVAERINTFMSRKAREFPELELSRKWNEYEYVPKRRSFGETHKRLAWS